MNTPRGRGRESVRYTLVRQIGSRGAPHPFDRATSRASQQGDLVVDMPSSFCFSGFGMEFWRQVPRTKSDAFKSSFFLKFGWVLTL